MNRSNSFLTTPVAVLLGSMLISIAILMSGGIIKIGSRTAGTGANVPVAPSIAPQQAPGQPPQQPTSSKVSVDDDPVLGNKNAQVTLIEFSDYECPFCKRHFDQVYPSLKKDYIDTGKVKMVIYVNPPIEMTKAALCAQEQNKFIEFHDYTFAHQKEITQEADIKIFANNAGLDSTKFDVCYASDKYNALAGNGNQPGKWYQEGVARGVDATPTFFVNGQKFVGAYPYSEFQKIIDEKLNAK